MKEENAKKRCIMRFHLTFGYDEAAAMTLYSVYFFLSFHTAFYMYIYHAKNKGRGRERERERQRKKNIT